jgi:translocation and assembly module TamB
VDITLNSTLNIDPLKGEKVKLKVGGEVRKTLQVGGFSRFRGDDAARRRAAGGSRLPLNMELKSKQLYWPFSGEKQFQADDVLLKSAA